MLPRVLASVPASGSGLRVSASLLLFNGLLCSLALHSASSLPAGLPRAAACRSLRQQVACGAGQFPAALGSQRVAEGWEHRSVASLCFP